MTDQDWKRLYDEALEDKTASYVYPEPFTPRQLQEELGLELTTEEKWGINIPKKPIEEH